jgi:hypothetical protein
MFLIVGSILFWALFEQAGSSLNLFTDRHVDRAGVPASVFQSLNPIYIVLLAPGFAWLWTWLGRRGMEPSAPAKFGLAMMQLGAGFLVLVAGAYAMGVENLTPVIFIFLIYLLHTTGELCLSPVGLSAMNRLAPSHMASLIMGTWFFASATGNFAAGLIAAADVAPLRPANCGFLVAWSESFRSRFEGRPLKRVALTCGDKTVRGEALVTAGGIEGGAIYALAASLRDTIDAEGVAALHVDLRPDLALVDLAGRLSKPHGKQSLSTFLRKAANFSPVEIGLLHETAGTRLSDMTPVAIAALAKGVPIRLTGVAPLATAISTAGGIPWDEVDAQLMLHKLPGVFVAGEMLDWEAPTGGYLLQACFSTGALAARGALAWLAGDRVLSSRKPQTL